MRKRNSQCSNGVAPSFQLILQCNSHPFVSLVSNRKKKSHPTTWFQKPKPTWFWHQPNTKPSHPILLVYLAKYCLIGQIALVTNHHFIHYQKFPQVVQSFTFFSHFVLQPSNLPNFIIMRVGLVVHIRTRVCNMQTPIELQKPSCEESCVQSKSRCEK